MKSKRQPLVSQYLESVSRRALEEYQDVVRTYVRGRHGIYVLYRREHLYYVGLASNLRNRLKAHLKDRHGASWDRFSVYLTIQDGHVKELESLALRILKPAGNKMGGKFARAQNLRPLLAQEIRILERDRLKDLFETGHRDRVRREHHRKSKAGGQAVLAQYVTRPMRLRREYKGKKLIARVRSDGTIRFRGQVFNSPSLAARAAVDKPRAVNGWHFWSYERSPGDWVRLDSLRK